MCSFGDAVMSKQKDPLMNLFPDTHIHRHTHRHSLTNKSLLSVCTHIKTRVWIPAHVTDVPEEKRTERRGHTCKQTLTFFYFYVCKDIHRQYPVSTLQLKCILWSSNHCR